VWEKIITSYLLDKGIILRIYKINKGKNNVINWANEVNRQFSGDEVQRAH
jgi:hypothetical protein